MTKKWCILALTGGLLLATVPGEAASADKQLQKGIEAYQKNDNDKAMDYFIDVLMTGDSEQVAKANKYIDAIHNQMGGIKNPVEVNVTFPEDYHAENLKGKEATFKCKLNSIKFNELPFKFG